MNKKKKKLREYFPEDYEDKETGLELKLKEEDVKEDKLWHLYVSG